MERRRPGGYGTAGPVAGLLPVRGAAHAVAVASKALSLAGSCGASGRDLRLTVEQGRAWWAGCRRHAQEGSGRVRNRAKARVNWASQGQRRGKCSVRRRAERVSRPAREKNRRLRVLVVTTCSPRPMRDVQRARLCAIACTASHAALAAKRPDGRWLRPTPYLRSRMAFSISAWRWSNATCGLSPRVRGNLPHIEKAPRKLRSTPRGRGNLLIGEQGHRPRGSIPASAGEPLAWCPPESARRVYPRECGGTRG